MKRSLLIMIMVLVGFSGPTTTNYVNAGEDREEGFQLSRKLRRILSAEMNAVQNGITNLSIAVPAGRWNEISETAGKMKETYILKRKLSKSEIDELNKSFPAGYRELDSAFTKSAAMLAKAAEEHNGEQVSLFFNSLKFHLQMPNI